MPATKPSPYWNSAGGVRKQLAASNAAYSGTVESGFVRKLRSSFLKQNIFKFFMLN